MTAQTVLTGAAEVRAAAGSLLGTSDWRTIERSHFELLAEATGDHEATYLAVSLSNMFLPQIVEVRGFAMGVNYGAGAVRILTGLRAGDRVRASARLVDVAEVSQGIQTRIDITVETERAGPACTIESLSRWLGPE